MNIGDIIKISFDPLLCFRQILPAAVIAVIYFFAHIYFKEKSKTDKTMNEIIKTQFDRILMLEDLLDKKEEEQKKKCECVWIEGDNKECPIHGVQS